MSVKTTSDTPRAQPLPPARLFWIPMLVLDLLLLLALRKAHVVAIVLASLGVLILLWRHPRLGLALASLGAILMNPLYDVFHSEVPAFVVQRIILAGPLLMLAWNRIWRPPEPDSRQAALSGLRREPVFLWASLLGLVLLVCYAWSPLPLYGRFKVSYYFLDNLLLLVAACVYLRPRPGETDPAVEGGWQFFRAAFYVEIAISAAGTYDALTHSYLPTSRLVTLGVNTIHLSKEMAVGLLMILFLGAARRIRPWIAVPAALVMAWVFYRTGSRGPLLALAAGLAFWVMTVPGRTGFRLRVLAGLGLVGGVIALLFLLPGYSEGWLGPLTGRENSNFVRLHLLKVAGDAVAGSLPWGVGTGGFPRLLKLADVRYFPHNLFAEVLTENGIAGMIALLGFLLALLHRWNRARRRIRAGESVPGQALLVRAAGSLLVFSLVMAQVSGDIITNDWTWLWAGALLAWTPRRDAPSLPEVRPS